MSRPTPRWRRALSPILLVAAMLMLALGQPWPVALLLGAIAVETGAASTLMVIRENNAAGPFTEVVTSTIGLNNILALFAFSVAAMALDMSAMLTDTGVSFRGLAQTIFPLLRTADVGAVLAELLPELADGASGLEPPPSRARRRYLLPPTALALAAGAVAAIALELPWLLAAGLAGLAYGWLRWRAAGWRLAGGRLAVRSRMLARTTVLAPARNRESHDLEQTVLQRRDRLAHVQVAFGKSTTARIRHLDLDVARRLWVSLT